MSKIDHVKSLINLFISLAIHLKTDISFYLKTIKKIKTVIHK